MGITNYTDPTFESDKVSKSIEEDRLNGKIKTYKKRTFLSLFIDKAITLLSLLIDKAKRSTMLFCFCVLLIVVVEACILFNLFNIFLPSPISGLITLVICIFSSLLIAELLFVVWDPVANKVFREYIE